METLKRSLCTALLVEGAFVLFLGSIIYADVASEFRNGVLWSFFAGTALVVLGTVLLKNNRLYDQLRNWMQKIAGWLSISPFQLFLLISSPIFTILTINAAGFGNKMRSPQTAIFGWLIGIGLAVYGGWNLSEEKARVSKSTILWFSAVALLAFLIRAIAADQIPILFNGDEASGGVNALGFIKGDWDNPFITGWYSFPSLYFFLQSIGLRVLGHNVEALRIPSAVAGALTVGFVYLTGKTMFGHKAGLFAALILAALHFHIHFSRQGLNNIWDGLWFTVTIAMLWYGWKFHARWAYLLAGFSLGFSQYFYASSKALILLVCVLAALAFASRRTQFLSATPHFVTASMVTLAVLLPLAWFYLHAPQALVQPFARVSNIGETFSSTAAFGQFLFQRVPVSLGAYTYSSLAGFYSPGTPILRPMMAALFYLGVAFLCLKDRDSRFMFLALWLAVFVLINALSWTFGFGVNSFMGPVSQRLIASAPACALIAGYGLDKLSNMLMELWPRITRVIQWVTYVLLAAIMISDLFFYFVEFTASSYLDELESNGMAAYRAGIYLKDQPAGTEVVIFGTPRMRANSPAIQYLAPHVHVVAAPADDKLLKRDLVTYQNALFIFLPEYEEKIETIENLYPGGLITSQPTWLGGTLFWVYEPAANR